MSLGNLSLSGGAILNLTAGVYNLNSINLSGGSQIIVQSGPVVMNIVGTSQATPINFNGGTTSNMTFDPSRFRILSGGTGNVRLNGGTSSSAMVYAPNAAIDLSGGADYYGSVLGRTVNVSGGVRVHYDRNLGGSFGTTGNRMLTSFTWKKF